jgi:peptide deformylase
MFKIVKDTNKEIFEKCEPIDMPLSKELIKTGKEMVEYLKKSQDDEWASKNGVRSGVGLAAPQIGIKKRMFAIYYEKLDEKGNTQIVQYCLVNPKIVMTSNRLCALRGGEGCLSVDKDQEGYVYRHHKIILKAFDILTNKDITITATGYDAIVLQHEYDHLDGILYYERIDKEHPHNEKPNSYLI